MIFFDFPLPLKAMTTSPFDKRLCSCSTKISSYDESFDQARITGVLSTNEIAGAGLDVYEREPLPENNKLRFLPNALLTPHIGYVTAENYSTFYHQMIESLESCVNGKPIRIIE